LGDGTQVNHTREFAAVANTSMAYQNTLTVTKAKAITTIDLLLTSKLLQQVKTLFNDK